jgi:cell division protein FtsQ
VVAFFQAALPAARTRGLEIRAIELDQRRHWWLHFAEGLTVSLGRESRDARLSQFLRVYPQLVADPKRRPERVDMRYTHGFAVRWRDAQVEPAAVKNPQEKV